MSLDDRPRSLRRRVMLAVWVIRAILTIFVMARLLRPVVLGEENIPIDGPVIFAMNHPSEWDPPALLLALAKRRDKVFLAKDSLFKIRVFGPLMRWLGHIPVARGTEAAIAASQKGIAVLRQGGSLVASIEGKLSPKPGEMGQAKNGVSFMALETQARVVPIGLFGTERVKPPGTHWLKWGLWKRYIISIGQPLTPPNLSVQSTTKDRDGFTQVVVNAINQEIQRARSCELCKTDPGYLATV